MIHFDDYTQHPLALIQEIESLPRYYEYETETPFKVIDKKISLTDEFKYLNRWDYGPTLSAFQFEWLDPYDDTGESDIQSKKLRVRWN